MGSRCRGRRRGDLVGSRQPRCKGGETARRSRCPDLGPAANSNKTRWKEKIGKSMTLRGGTVVCCQGKLSLGSGTPIIAGPLQLLILDIKYFENPRQKRRNVYCLARKREMEKHSELKAKT